MARRENRMTVQRTEWVTPHMVRVVLGGAGFEDFVATGDTDMYVKLAFPPAGVEWGPQESLADIREGRPPEEHPVLRTYTVRRVDEAAREIAIDVVVHGDDGVAGPWARDVRPGEEIRFNGPGSGYRPMPDADWHLLAADESGLPAVAAALEALPDDATARVYLEVAGPDDELDLRAPAGATIQWVHRGAGAHEVDEGLSGGGAPLVAAVREGEWLDGVVQVFVHGEAEAVMKHLRPYLRRERGVPASRASISGYWRRGRTEEGFRRWKADLRAAEETQVTQGLPV